MNLCVWRILTLSSYSHFAQGHEPYLFSTYIPCAILELSDTIPELADRVRIPTLRRTVPELYRFLLCAEHIHDRVRLAVFFCRRLTICTTVFPYPITFWTRLMFNHVRVGKEWAGPVFLHPLTNNFRVYAYSWKGKVGWVFLHPINHMHNSFSPPDNLLHKVDV